MAQPRTQIGVTSIAWAGRTTRWLTSQAPLTLLRRILCASQAVQRAFLRSELLSPIISRLSSASLRFRSEHGGLISSRLCNNPSSGGGSRGYCWRWNDGAYCDRAANGIAIGVKITAADISCCSRGLQRPPEPWKTSAPFLKSSWLQADCERSCSGHVERFKPRHHRRLRTVAPRGDHYGLL